MNEICKACGGGGIVYWREDVIFDHATGDGANCELSDFCPECERGERLRLAEHREVLKGVLELFSPTARGE
jgi:hypothetical protein